MGVYHRILYRGSLDSGGGTDESFLRQPHFRQL